MRPWGGRPVEEGGDGGRPLGRRPQRVAGGQGDRPDQAVGDQGVAGPDGGPVVAEGEVGQRVIRCGHGRGQAGVGRSPDQGRRQRAGGHDQQADIEDGGHRGGEQAAEAALQRHAGPEPCRHPPDLRHHAAKSQIGADVPVVGDQPQDPVGERGRGHGQGRPEHAGALAAGGSTREGVGLAAEQPGQERLDQGLLHVQALDDMEDGAAGQQPHRGQPGRPVPAAQAAGQQQQPDPGGGHGHRGPS